MTDLYLTGIGHLTTNSGDPVRGAVVAVDDGRVTYAGPEADAPEAGSRQVIECDGRAVIPGFVDAHTHVVFAGDRSDEFRRKMDGETYRDIAAAGGGIAATVSATRKASEEELLDLALGRVRHMMATGTTAVEIKSGYGLDTETEVRLLRVARQVGAELGITVRTSFLGAHTVPPDVPREEYLDLLVSEMIPAASGLADYCDVFVEEGVFSVDEARAVLAAAREHGMGLRVHAEQLSHSGGAALAAEMGAVSADHLDHVTPEDARALADAGVAAVLVPGASYMLRSTHAPARMLWDSGCTVAVATDCNPGTSYFEAMGPIISLAVVQMGLTVEQAIWAATRGGALALELDGHGQLATGSVADLVVLDAPDPAHIPYRPATDLAWRVIRGGAVV